MFVIPAKLLFRRYVENTAPGKQMISLSSCHRDVSALRTVREIC